MKLISCEFTQSTTNSTHEILQQKKMQTSKGVTEI